MKKTLITFLLSFGLLANIQAQNWALHWNEPQVLDYVHYSELQRRSSWLLLSQIKFKGTEAILDVGCGDGRNSATMSCLVPEGFVIGIDPSVSMLKWAKKQYHPFEYPNLFFQEGDANCLPNKTFDLITSFFSLHIVKDKQAAILGFYDHLTKGGQVIAVIPPIPQANPEFSESIQETMQSVRWQGYFEGFQTTFRFEDLEDYKRYFEQAGFALVRAQNAPSVDPFVNIDEYINWFLGTWPQIHRIPKDLRRTFVLDIVDRYLTLRPDRCSEEGVITFHWGRYEIIAQKN